MADTRPDLSGLERAIRLKMDLLCSLALTSHEEWPQQITRFVAEVEDSALSNKTALLVLLTELREEIRLLGGGDHVRPLEVANRAGRRETDWSRLTKSDLLEQFEQDVTASLPASVSARRSASPLVQRVAEVLERDYAQSLTLQRVAVAVGRSKRHVAAIFKRQLGLTIHDYLTKIRMREATVLIRNGEKIEAVSLLVGYRSKTNFYRHFKATVGLTPVAYRAIQLTFIPPLRNDAGRRH